MAGRRNHVLPGFNFPRRCDFGRNLGARQHPAMTWLGTLRQLDLNHLDLLAPGVAFESLFVERAIGMAATEIATADLPDQITAALLVIARNRPLAGVMGEATGLGATIECADRIGRKPVMIVFTFIGMITPLTALYFDGPLWMMGVLFFIGWSATGSFPLFMGVVPGESVSPKLAATSMGLVVCIGELVGGFASPTLAGMLSDQTTMQAPMYYCLICAFLSGIAALFLKETAPSKVSG